VGRRQPGQKRRRMSDREAWRHFTQGPTAVNTVEESPHTSNEGEKKKFKAAVGSRGWDNAKQGRFHTYLTKNYGVEKRNLEERQLRKIADEFEAQDNSNWNNKQY
jgi:hypothetical protein